MKKPLPKLTWHDDIFHLFLKCSLWALLLIAVSALVWGQRFREGTALLLLVLMVGGAAGYLALLRRKPTVFHRKRAHLAPRRESYAEIDALLTEMEIPHYENRATKPTKTTGLAGDPDDSPLIA
jgi:hypothetical protein